MTCRTGHFVLKGGVFGGIQGRNLAPWVLQPTVSRHCYVHLPSGSLAAFGGYDNYAVRTACPINCCGRGILKHFNRFDIVGVQVVDAATDNHTVHYIKRVGPVNRCRSANADHAPGPRLAGTLGYLNSCGSPLKGLLHAKKTHAFEVFGLNLSDGSGDVALFLRTKTNHNDFVEFRSLRAERYAHSIASGNDHVGVSQGPDAQVGSRSRCNAKPSLGIGGCEHFAARGEANYCVGNGGFDTKFYYGSLNFLILYLTLGCWG